MTTIAQKQMETSMGEAMNLRLASPFHLHGVGPAYTWKLALSGIQTIQELLDYHDLSELSESSCIPFKVLSMMRMKARSIVNDEIIQIAPFWMPRMEPIYIDIETVPKWDKVWLIGLLVETRSFSSMQRTTMTRAGFYLSSMRY